MEYEPLAEELRLWGGEWTLDCASEILFPALADTVIPSPAEFSKLGVCDERKLVATLARGDFLVLVGAPCMLIPPSEVLFLVDVVEAIDAAVGGREFAFGGCGNAPILTVFRTALLEGIPESFSVFSLAFMGD